MLQSSIIETMILKILNKFYRECIQIDSCKKNEYKYKYENKKNFL